MAIGRGREGGGCLSYQAIGERECDGEEGNEVLMNLDRPISNEARSC